MAKPPQPKDGASMPVGTAMSKSEHLDELLARLVHENDELRAENRRLREEVDQPLTSVGELAVALIQAGYKDVPAGTLHDLEYWALTFPTWWEHSMLTEEGRRHVRLTRYGVSFTSAGVSAAFNHFIPR